MIPSAPLGTDAAAGRSAGLGAATEAGPDQAAAERRFRFELAAHPGSPAQARRLTRARLTGWSVCEDTCDSAALIVSELVTNAVVHTASAVVVCELHDGDDLLRIAVRDEGCAPGEPHPSPQRPDEEHGRGLLLVDALCDAWGAQEHGPGLLVWAELPRRAAAPREEPATDGADAPREAPATDRADAPHNDLGWGARPKRGPSRGSGDEDEPAQQGYEGQETAGTPTRVGRQLHRAPEETAATGPHDIRGPRFGHAPVHDHCHVHDHIHDHVCGHGGHGHPKHHPAPHTRPGTPSSAFTPLGHGSERGRG